MADSGLFALKYSEMQEVLIADLHVRTTLQANVIVPESKPGWRSVIWTGKKKC